MEYARRMNEGETGILALKPVALKRKAVANGDKVRYRVYVAPQEFIAVIAENALMAMKLSGVTAPIRIVRDLPLAQTSVDGDRLTTHHLQPTVFIKPESSPAAHAFQPMAIEHDKEGAGFVAMGIEGLFGQQRAYNSTIDVSVMLRALPEHDMPIDAPIIERDRPVAKHKQPVEPEPVIQSSPELVAEPLPPEESGLSQEEIERLLNEPRA